MNFKLNPLLTAVALSALASSSAVFAATSLNLRQHSLAEINSLTLSSLAREKLDLHEIKRVTDRKSTAHVRLKQQYAGYPVWGGDAVIHTPASDNKKSNLQTLLTRKNAKTKMNGIVYQDLAVDLQNTPAYVFQSTQADKAANHAAFLYKNEQGKNSVLKTKKQLMVYVDKAHKAHWAFLVSMLTKSINTLREEPVYILDAVTFAVYEQWNNLKTLETVNAGGYGGNYSDFWIYDYIGYKYKPFPHHRHSFEITRDETSGNCYLQNEDITVKDGRHDGAIAQFPCAQPDETHNNLYWNGKLDEVNGALSPSNDVFNNTKIVKEMYTSEPWSGTPLFIADDGDFEESKKPFMINLIVHSPQFDSNAAWSDFTQEMYFGDGNESFYPLVSLDIVAHELSHGFTSQNSGLVYEGQSGGLNESFSDMAAMAAMAYASTDGSWNWSTGAAVHKDGKAVRYIDNPRRDCIGKPRGPSCSIDNAKDYKDYYDVHFTSGVFNKAFYLLSTAPNWDIAKAFAVMVQANAHYWIPKSTFAEAACGVMDAARDYGYETNTVTNVMKQVGLDTSHC